MEKREADLLKRIQQDDKKALEEVYLLHQTAFLHFAQSFSLRREDALDIYQDSIIALYQNIVIQQRLPINSSLKTYLFGIGKHKIYDWFKARQKTHRLIDEGGGVEEMALPGDEGPTEEQERLARHFAQLSESCQNILRQFYYRGWTIKEIVTHTHYKDENTVKSHKSRCLKKLMELIKNG